MIETKTADLKRYLSITGGTEAQILSAIAALSSEIETPVKVGGKSLDTTGVKNQEPHYMRFAININAIVVNSITGIPTGKYAELKVFSDSRDTASLGILHGLADPARHFKCGVIGVGEEAALAIGKPEKPKIIVRIKPITAES